MLSLRLILVMNENMKKIFLTSVVALAAHIGFAQVTTTEPENNADKQEEIPLNPDAKVENDTRFELHEVIETQQIEEDYIIIRSSGEETVILRDPEAVILSPEEEEEDR